MAAGVRGLIGYFYGTTLPPSASPPPAQSQAPTLSATSPALPSQLVSTLPLYAPLPPPATILPTITHASSEAEWLRGENLARAHIILNVVDPASFGISESMPVVEIWSTLRSMFEVTNPTLVADMRMKIQTTYWEPGVPITDHFARAREFLRVANNTGGSITDAEFT